MTSEVTAMGVANLLETIRLVNRNTRFYQPSTSETLGKVQEVPQTKVTAFHPRCPYGVSKLFGHWMTVNYRESYNMYTCADILFNHESPLRGPEFVTRKITDERDWGFAREYVEAMWLMLQQSEPQDYVIATGQTHTVREFLDLAFKVAGIKFFEDYVDYNNEEHNRPVEVDLLLGDATKARAQLGWEPKTHFHELVRMMVAVDLERQSKLMTSEQHDHQIAHVRKFGRTYLGETAWEQRRNREIGG